MSETCATCRFNGPNVKGPEDTLICRRNPPMVFPEEGGLRTTIGWPPVRSYAWCGEYSPRAPATIPNEGPP